MARLGDTLRRASLRLAMAAVLGLLGLALATTADVLMRWLFARPIIGLGDAVTVAGAVCLAACMPSRTDWATGCTASRSRRVRSLACASCASSPKAPC